MNIAKSVDSYINHQRYGRIFTIDELVECKKLQDSRNTVLVTLKRQIDSGKVKKASSGLYYRPKKSKFGYLPIDTKEVVKSISKKKKATYVISGAAALNSLGLSTQLPMVYSYIISERVRSNFKSINMKFEYSESLSNFTKNLRIKDETQKQNALLIWSAINYINKDKFDDYKVHLLSFFQKKLDDKARLNFLKALPHSMLWAKKNIENEIRNGLH